MKSGLAALPMDVWADVFVYPWITRKKLAQIVDKFKERGFAAKLQTFLHDPKCGKHSLRYLDISLQEQKAVRFLTIKKLCFQIQTECHASLAISPDRNRFHYKECEFPQTEMPENIKKFNQLSIGFVC